MAVGNGGTEPRAEKPKAAGEENAGARVRAAAGAKTGRRSQRLSGGAPMLGVAPNHPSADGVSGGNRSKSSAASEAEASLRNKLRGVEAITSDQIKGVAREALEMLRSEKLSPAALFSALTKENNYRALLVINHLIYKVAGGGDSDLIRACDEAFSPRLPEVVTEAVLRLAQTPTNTVAKHRDLSRHLHTWKANFEAWPRLQTALPFIPWTGLHWQVKQDSTTERWGTFQHVSGEHTVSVVAPCVVDMKVSWPAGATVDWARFFDHRDVQSSSPTANLIAALNHVYSQVRSEGSSARPEMCPIIQVTWSASNAWGTENGRQIGVLEVLFDCDLELCLKMQTKWPAAGSFDRPFLALDVSVHWLKCRDSKKAEASLPSSPPNGVHLRVPARWAANEASGGATQFQPGSVWFDLFASFGTLMQSVDLYKLDSGGQPQAHLLARYMAIEGADSARRILSGRFLCRKNAGRAAKAEKWDIAPVELEAGDYFALQKEIEAQLPSATAAATAQQGASSPGAALHRECAPAPKSHAATTTLSPRGIHPESHAAALTTSAPRAEDASQAASVDPPRPKWSSPPAPDEAACRRAKAELDREEAHVRRLADQVRAVREENAAQVQARSLSSIVPQKVAEARLPAVSAAIAEAEELAASERADSLLRGALEPVPTVFAAASAASAAERMVPPPPPPPRERGLPPTWVEEKAPPTPAPGQDISFDGLSPLVPGATRRTMPPSAASLSSPEVITHQGPPPPTSFGALAPARETPVAHAIAPATAVALAAGPAVPPLNFAPMTPVPLHLSRTDPGSADCVYSDNQVIPAVTSKAMSLAPTPKTSPQALAHSGSSGADHMPWMLSAGPLPGAASLPGYNGVGSHGRRPHEDVWGMDEGQPPRQRQRTGEDDARFQVADDAKLGTPTPPPPPRHQLPATSLPQAFVDHACLVAAGGMGAACRAAGDNGSSGDVDLRQHLEHAIKRARIAEQQCQDLQAKLADAEKQRQDLQSTLLDTEERLRETQQRLNAWSASRLMPPAGPAPAASATPSTWQGCEGQAAVSPGWTATSGTWVAVGSSGGPGGLGPPPPPAPPRSAEELLWDSSTK